MTPLYLAAIIAIGVIVWAVVIEVVRARRAAQARRWS